MPLGACCVLLAACGCKGRHADATPTGETVEVALQEMTAADTVAAQPVVPVADTAVAPQAPLAAQNTEITAVPARQDQEEEQEAAPSAPAGLPEPVLPAAR